ncbi:hypothetical protein BJ741DRAFT_11645 [Chytriomyces cf. hyalinus JEL632]|nr:hypothetical protein BJ741DRAFT_11645 [Chytriomyces cf. hyalinus JEL632]
MADWIDCLENDFEPGAQNHNLASPTSSLPPFKNHTLYGHFNEAAEPLHFPPLTLSSPVTPGAAQYNAYHSYSLEPFLESSDPFTSPVPSRGSRRASMNSDMHSFAAPYINATTFETPSSHLQSRKSLEFNNLPPSHGNLSYISNRSASLSKSSPPPLLQPTSSITGQSGNNTFSPMSVSTNRSFLLQTAPSGYATAVAGGTPRGHPRQPMTLVSTPSPQAQHQQPLSPTSTTPISANAVNPGGWSTVAQSHAISSQGSARLPRNGPVYATSIHRSNMHVSGGTTTGIIPAVVMKGIKSKDPLKPGDWICPNAACRFHNFARRVSCVACGVSDKAAGRF